ncbi:TIGR04282 family arsenosugar biosynthesis glycosyltransferase [Azospirillum griseum]|uniref:Glycosyltransferase n=1 Tax=Azospirillum griseum TaxID=2496639 RepID=A0A431VA56_9PROT|nr:TIGR04282 family arsenosugar biosynthesis glycosyltransferase [Azospirillum griseum]RTR13094.1 glycosyltransferase [Azospirillum griseum]
MSLTPHLVIFTRLPRLGTGKRRLAADIGPVMALTFQRATLALTIKRLGRDPRWRTWLAVTPRGGGPWPADLPRIIQPAGDLGRRMAHIAKALPPGPVLIVGSDVPDIRPFHIADAFRALGDRDAVLGPAEDGGYWLVGLKRRPRFVDPFDGVRWSTPDALADTLANLARHRTATVDTLADIDDGASLMRHRQRTRSR